MNDLKKSTLDKAEEFITSNKVKLLDMNKFIEFLNVSKIMTLISSIDEIHILWEFLIELETETNKSKKLLSSTIFLNNIENILNALLFENQAIDNTYKAESENVSQSSCLVDRISLLRTSNNNVSNKIKNCSTSSFGNEGKIIIPNSIEEIIFSIEMNEFLNIRRLFELEEIGQKQKVYTRDLINIYNNLSMNKSILRTKLYIILYFLSTKNIDIGKEYSTNQLENILLNIKSEVLFEDYSILIAQIEEKIIDFEENDDLKSNHIDINQDLRNIIDNIDLYDTENNDFFLFISKNSTNISNYLTSIINEVNKNIKESANKEILSLLLVYNDNIYKENLQIKTYIEALQLNTKKINSLNEYIRKEFIVINEKNELLEEDIKKLLNRYEDIGHVEEYYYTKEKDYEKRILELEENIRVSNEVIFNKEMDLKEIVRLNSKYESDISNYKISFQEMNDQIRKVNDLYISSEKKYNELIDEINKYHNEEINKNHINKTKIDQNSYSFNIKLDNNEEIKSLIFNNDQRIEELESKISLLNKQIITNESLINGKSDEIKKQKEDIDKSKEYILQLKEINQENLLKIESLIEKANENNVKNENFQKEKSELCKKINDLEIIIQNSKLNINTNSKTIFQVDNILTEMNLSKVGSEIKLNEREKRRSNNDKRITMNEMKNKKISKNYGFEEVSQFEYNTKIHVVDNPLSSISNKNLGLQYSVEVDNENLFTLGASSPDKKKKKSLIKQLSTIKDKVNYDFLYLRSYNEINKIVEFYKEKNNQYEIFSDYVYEVKESNKSKKKLMMNGFSFYLIRLTDKIKFRYDLGDLKVLQLSKINSNLIIFKFKNVDDIIIETPRRIEMIYYLKEMKKNPMFIDKLVNFHIEFSDNMKVFRNHKIEDFQLESNITTKSINNNFGNARKFGYFFKYCRRVFYHKFIEKIGVLTDIGLLIYDDLNDKQPKENINIINSSFSIIDESKFKRKGCFEIKEVSGLIHSFYCRGGVEEANSWIGIFKKIKEEHSIYQNININPI